MFATMLKIFAIIAALSGHINGVTVTVPQSMVNVTVGGNVTLLCTYKTTGPLDSLFIQWSFYSAKEKQHETIFYFQNGQTFEYGEFKNRINGTTNPGNASITISNMQPSDTGLFTCEVFNPQDSNGQNQKSVAVSVLVKPSQPHCSLRGTPETGHLISLSCYSDEGMPIPIYQWHKVSGDALKPMTEQLNMKTGLLIIGNLTTFENGYYRCIASNSLGNSSCEIDLTASHSEGGLIAGALIGAILGAIVICIVVWFLTKRKKKEKIKEKAANSEMQPMTQKQQTNVEYVNIPTQENEYAATATPSGEPNATNENSTAGETAASGMPENEEMKGEETQARV
uniref:V-set and immunoglobulin domain-containing protein 1 n=1 Tax=Pelodiscus sinensis TaxID=13735 RepID=K7FQP7_PELSI|nr:V-set and immunoglobulin domain-containing protein 1 isoform X2 [Pelodiscus sinensis]|eukprot:XP_014435614.1 V-set and immunoglobulin domain-containing protein 1 isoform X2 [Pelodiscus sinensis]